MADIAANDPSVTKVDFTGNASFQVRPTRPTSTRANLTIVDDVLLLACSWWLLARLSLYRYASEK